MEEKTWNTIFKNVPIVLVVLGIIILLLTLIGGVQPYFTIPKESKSWLIVLGLCVILFGMYLLWFEKLRHRNTKYHDFGIKIEFPTEGTMAKSPISASGSFKKHPATDNFYLVEYNEKANLYWPKGRVGFNQKTNKWNATLNIGTVDNRRTRVIIAAMSEAGMVLITYYNLISNATGQHKGIPNFDKAFETLDTVNIIVEKPV